MKKLMILALGLAAAGLAACGEKPTPTSNSVPDKYSDKVLAISEGSVHAVGGYTADNWKAKEENKMTATSIKAVSELSTSVADKLLEKQLDYLYMKEITVGVEENGGTEKCKKDGKIYIASQSYCVKALQATYDSEEETYIAGQWISDPKTAHAEALNENIFFPTWTEEADEDGFAWNMNPVVIGGAGTYVQVVAKYKAISAPDVAGYGFAMIKKSAAAEGTAQKFEEYVAPSTDTYGLVGTMTGWADGSDIPLDLKGEIYTVRTAIDKEAEFKIRMNGLWATQFNAANLDKTVGAGANFSGTDNIICDVAGDYIIKLDVVAKKIEIYTVTYGLVGTMNEWGGTPDTDLALVEGSVYAVTVEIAANAQFKIRLNNSWDYGDFGFSALDSTCSAFASFTDEGGNIKCVTPGNYRIALDVSTLKIAIANA